MAQLPNMFDATQVNPNFGPGQLPVGIHNVIIDESDVKDNNAGTGKYLQLDLRVISGENEGETGAMRLNIYSSNDKARDISMKELSRLCHALGQMQISDSAQLHNIPFQVEVVNQKGSETLTEVKRIFRADGSDPVRGTFTGPSSNNGFQKPSLEDPAPQPQPQTQQQPAANPEPQPQQQAAWGAQNNQQPAANPAAGGWTPGASAPAAGAGGVPWANN